MEINLNVLEGGINMQLGEDSFKNNIIGNELNTEVGLEKKQNKFLESTLGKVINVGIDLGLRALLPDLIENQVIDVKNTLFNEGLSQGIKKAVSSAVDLGKSAIGVVTGNFENISQVQVAVQKGGLIDGVSDALDFVLDKTQEKGVLSNDIARTIKSREKYFTYKCIQ